MDDYALNYFGNKITFQKLFEMINTAAKAFQAIGVQEGDIVPVVSVSTVASVVCLYALNRIGAVVDFLNVLSERDDLVNYFMEAKAKIVVTLDLFGEKVAAAAEKCCVEKVIAFGVDYEMPGAMMLAYKVKTCRNKQPWKASSFVVLWSDFLKLARKQPDINYRKDPHAICLLGHTGGTTGEPKAVMLSDSAMNAATRTYQMMMTNAKRKDVFLHIMVPFVVYGILSCTHVPLCLGFCVVIIPKFDAVQWTSYLKKYRPNHIMAVPAYIAPLLDVKCSELSLIKNLASGGDGMNYELENALNQLLNKYNSPAVITKGYAMTEVCATAVASFQKVNKVGSVGIPLPGNNVQIFNTETGKEQSYGEIGEICLQCKSRMLGYMNHEQEMKKLFSIHDDGSEWLHTGDLGYMDEDGFLFLEGRMKRVILTVKDGVTYKVFPNMTEKILEENDRVVRSCVVGAKTGFDQVLRAYVVVAKDEVCRSKEVEEELRSLCEKKLPSYARPMFYEFREELPLTAAGKINYRELEK